MADAKSGEKNQMAAPAPTLDERVASMEADLKHLATKADIESVKKLISDRESTMLRWLMGMMAAAGVSVAIAMIRTFLA